MDFYGFYMGEEFEAYRFLGRIQRGTVWCFGPLRRGQEGFR